MNRSIDVPLNKDKIQFLHSKVSMVKLV